MLQLLMNDQIYIILVTKLNKIYEHLHHAYITNSNLQFFNEKKVLKSQ